MKKIKTSFFVLFTLMFGCGVHSAWAMSGEEMGKAIGEKIDDAGKAVKEHTLEAAEKGKQLVESTEKKVKQGAKKAHSKGKEVVENMTEKGNQLRGKAKDKAHKMINKT